MPISDAERLRAAGHNVTLVGGEYPLIYDFSALLILERELGSLSAMQAALDAWSQQDKGINLDHLRLFLTAGLSHVPLTPSEVVGGIVLSELRNYVTAVIKATSQAFMAPDEDGPGNAQSEVVTSSNGHTSTTSPPSDTAVLTSTSGG